MTPQQQAAMRQALEALESCTPADTSTGHVVWPSYDEQAVEQAITALRQALEQQPADDLIPKEALFICGQMGNCATRVTLEQSDSPEQPTTRLTHLDGVVPNAIRGYLRRCSSGGMPKKQIDIVQANVDEAERLGYFKLAIAEAMLAARPQPAAPEQQLNALKNEAWNSGVCPVCNSKDESQPAAWVGLTEDEVAVLMMEAWGCASIAPQSAPKFARAIEIKLRSKNGGDK